MKKSILACFFILFLGVFFAACEDDAETSGTLTVQIFNATSFSPHDLYYTIYDSNATDPTYGYPTGNELGKGRIDIVNGNGSYLTTVSISDLTTAVYNNGTYYLGGAVDMNDNFPSNGYQPDSGDYYGDFITVAIDGDTTITVSESDFPNIMP